MDEKEHRARLLRLARHIEDPDERARYRAQVRAAKLDPQPSDEAQPGDRHDRSPETCQRGGEEKLWMRMR
jgi:hypothetical protein